MAQIKIDPKNTRLHNDSNKEAINKSLHELGAGRSIVIDNEDYIVAGNGVFEQAEKLGLKTKIIETDGSELVVIKRTDLNYQDEKRRKLAIADNATAESSSWNFEELNQDEIQEWDIEIMEPEEDKFEASEDGFEIPEKIETDIVLGDLFEIGPHRLMCGDSTKPEDVEKLMGGEKADMVLTDPPYNIAYKSGAWSKKRKANMDEIENDKLSEVDFVKFLSDAISLFHIYSKDTDKYIFNDWKCFHLFRDACINSDYQIKNVIVWNKEYQTQALNKFANAHELIIFIGNNKYPLLDINVWNCKREFDKDHPTPKPIKLLSKAVKYSSKENEIVMDTFLGSGSTMVAAHQLKRKCYGMEIDPNYCEVIIRRMIELDPGLTIKKNGVYNPKRLENG